MVFGPMVWGISSTVLFQLIAGVLMLIGECRAVCYRMIVRQGLEVIQLTLGLR